jgi:hypothetical protein
MKFTREQVLGIVRHILTFGSGIVVAKGLLDEAVAQSIIGGVLALIGTIWSVDAKRV